MKLPSLGNGKQGCDSALDLTSLFWRPIVTENLDSAAQADMESHLHPFSPPAKMKQEGYRSYVDRAEGVYHFDNKGNRRIDACAGLACVNIGYSRRDMAEAMRDAAERLSFHPSFFECGNPLSSELTYKLREILPCYLTHFSFACSGSES